MPWESVGCISGCIDCQLDTLHRCTNTCMHTCWCTCPAIQKRNHSWPLSLVRHVQLPRNAITLVHMQSTHATLRGGLVTMYALVRCMYSSVCQGSMQGHPQLQSSQYTYVRDFQPTAAGDTYACQQLVHLQWQLPFNHLNACMAMSIVCCLCLI